MTISWIFLDAEDQASRHVTLSMALRDVQKAVKDGWG